MDGGQIPKRPASPELAGESEALSALMMELASAPVRDPGDLAAPPRRGVPAAPAAGLPSVAPTRGK